MLKPLAINDTLELKPLVSADAASLFKLTEENRAYLRQWLPWLDRTVKVEDSAGFIQFVTQESAEGKGHVYGIWSESQLVGVCSYQNINKANRSASIGYWISKEHAGKGLARSATRKLIQNGFATMGFHRIEIRCASENIGSQKVAIASGLKYEGTCRECEWLYDHFVDHKVYGILHSDV